MNTITDKSSFYIINLFISVIFILLFSPYTTPLNPNYGFDDNIFMIIGQGINKGYVPYKDLFDHKGPVLFFIYALADIIHHGKVGVFILQIVNLYIINFCIYRIALLYGCSIKKTYIAILTFMVFFIGTIGEGGMNEEFSLSFIMIPFYLCLKQIHNSDINIKPSYIYTFLYGFFFALIFLIRANNTALICGIIIGYTIILLKDKQYTTLLKHLIVFLLGLFLICIPIMLYFIRENAFEDFIFYAFTYNYVYAVDGMKDTKVYIMKIIWILPTIILYLKTINLINKKEHIIILPCLIVSLFSVSLGNAYLHYYTLLLPLIVFFSIELLQNTVFKQYFILIFICFIPYTYTSAKNIGKILYFDILRTRDDYYTELNHIYNLIPDKDKDKTMPFELVYKDYALYTKYNMTPVCKFFHFQNKFMKDIKEVHQEVLYNCKNAIPEFILTSNINIVQSAEIKQYILDNYELIYSSNVLIMEVYKKESK